MSNHPYLRAYMAGIVAPTIFLLFAAAAFSIARFVYDPPVALERVIVFPMAVVPNAWGAWNMLYLGLRPRRLPIGLHGAALALLLVPLGILLQWALDVSVTPAIVATMFPVALAIYYLAWKYLVGFFNELLGITD